MKPQTQTSLQTLRRGKWWLLPALQTSKKPNNQETKKPRNKDTQKKQKKQKQPAGSGTERVVVAILWFCEFCETWYLHPPYDINLNLGGSIYKNVFMKWEFHGDACL